MIIMADKTGLARRHPMGGKNMPIKLKPVFQKGWKADQRDRYGNCLVIQFINTADGRILFEYAPLEGDMEVFNTVFATMREYSKHIQCMKEIEAGLTKEY
jgi:hypothetical protein